MSEHEREPLEHEAAATGVEAEAQQGDNLAELMREDGSAARRGSLDERARAEARRALAEQEAAARTIGPETETRRSVLDARRLRVLQGVLIGTVLLALGLLALPRPAPAGQGAGDYEPSGSIDRVATVAARSFDQAHRGEALGLPDDSTYQQAMLVALDGDFALACDLLIHYLERHEHLDEGVRRLVHAQVAYYQRKAGNLGAALEHERLARPGTQQAYLAEELLQAARSAQARGDHLAVRRAYARFLLQQDTMSPGMRALLDEAWLQMGDGYRQQADAGVQESDR